MKQWLLKTLMCTVYNIDNSILHDIDIYYTKSVIVLSMEKGPRRDVQCILVLRCVPIMERLI